jgi:hypothetical protein
MEAAREEPGLFVRRRGDWIHAPGKRKLFAMAQVGGGIHIPVELVAVPFGEYPDRLSKDSLEL